MSNMKFYAKSVSVFIVALFLGSVALYVVTDKSTTEPSYLEDEPIISEAQSPGHPVFAEYVGAHWCGPCHSMSANLHSVYGTIKETGSSVDVEVPLRDFMTFSEEMGFKEVWDFDKKHARS